MTISIDKKAVGIEVSWSFGDGDAEAVTIPRESFRDLLMDNMFDPTELVPEVSADAAMRSAVHKVKGVGRTIVVKQLQRPNKDTPRAFGIYAVTAREGETGDDVTMGARVRIHRGAVVCLPPDGQSYYHPEHEKCREVGEEFARIANSLIQNVVNSDISLALTGIGWHLGWISRRRNSGGVYFVHRSEDAERFVALLMGIRRLSAKLASNRTPHERFERNYLFRPQVMEVYPKPLTMDLWAGSTEDQFRGQTERLLADLQAMRKDDKMRDKTIESRASECDRLMELAESYRLFLADAVDSITAELTVIRDGFNRKLDERANATTQAFADIDQAVDTNPAPPRKKKATRKGSKKKATKVPATKAKSTKETLDQLCDM